MDDNLVIVTDEISLPLSNLEISADSPPQTEVKGQLNYNGPVWSHCQVARLLPKPKSNDDSRTKTGCDSLKPALGTFIKGIRNKTVHLGHAFDVVPDTQLGLTNDEIALLRHHQQAAASTAGGSSSKAASIASSQGLLLLDGSSLAALGRHFDCLMQQIQARLDYLSEQSQMVAQQRYDHAGNAIDVADLEISKLHAILRKLDEVELGFDKVKHIREIVRNYRKRAEELEELERGFVAPPPTRHQADRNTKRQSKKVSRRHLQEERASTQDQTLMSTMAMLEEASEPSLDAKNLNRDQSPFSAARSAGMIEDITEECGTLCSTTDGTTWSTSSDDSNELGSESSESLCSSTDWRHHLILEVVMLKVYRLLDHNAATVHGAYDQGGGTSSGDSGSWMSGAFSSTNQSSLFSTSNVAGMKRGNDGGDFPPPDEDPDGYKRPRNEGEDNAELRRYACPFFKNDPRKNRRRRSCAGPGFSSISHLKEHLYRCHIAPTQCPRCWVVVGDDRGLEIHLQNDTRCQKQERKPVDGISPQKLKLLKSKKRLPPIEGADSSKWSDIYRILFPGAQPIPSPYFDHDSEGVEGVDSKASSLSLPKDFGQYYQSRLPSLIETHVAQLLHEKLGPVEAEMKSMVTEITRKCLFDLVRDWQASQSETCAEGDTLRTYGDPGSATDAQGGFYLAENVFTGFQDGFVLGNSELSGLHGDAMIQAAADASFGFPQIGDWTQIATAESRLMDGSLELQKDIQLSTFVCLTIPQHPEPETYSGKGKDLESQDLKYCLECFPNSQLYGLLEKSA